MKTRGKLSRLACAAGIATVVFFPACGVLANEDGRNTTTGAIIGGVTGAVVTHGKLGGVVVGAAAGGLAGHLLTPHHKKRHVYYDRYGHRHVYYK